MSGQAPLEPVGGAAGAGLMADGLRAGELGATARGPLGPKGPGAVAGWPGSMAGTPLGPAGPTGAPALPLAVLMVMQPVSVPGQGVVVSAAFGGTMKVLR